MTSLSPQERISVFKKQPLFSNLESEALLALAAIAEEVNVKSGETFIHQGDLVDSFYLIAKGEVGIYQIPNQGINPQEVVLAVFHADEVIGLDTKGFFSKTGLRTASARAIKDTEMLRVTTEEFQKFFQQFPNLLTEMRASNNHFLRMQFIKKLIPFSHLKPESVKWLEAQMLEITIPSHTVILKEGEVGDSCYCIRKGKIKIVSNYRSKDEHTLAEITAPDIMGEIGMFTGAPSNATAVTLEECMLLELKRDQFLELHEKENSAFNAVITMMIERSRPQRLDHDVIVQPVINEKGENTYVLRNDKAHYYFKLTEETYFLWQQCDGLKNMKEISLNFREKFHDISVIAISAILYDLTNEGFIKIKGFYLPRESDAQPFWIKLLGKIRAIAEVKYAFKNTDESLSKLYNRVKFLYSLPALIFLTFFITIGFAGFGMSTLRVIHSLQTLSHVHLVSFLIIVQFVGLPLIFFHELGHGLTTKHFGRSIRGMGIGWYWLGPIAFTDTSEMWLSSTSHRIKVSLAGIIVDSFFAACFSFLAYFSSSVALSFLYWLIVFGRYLIILNNINPIIELDGYYVLADYLEEPELREKAVLWLTQCNFTNLMSAQFYKQNIKSMAFWLLSVCYVCITMFTVWVLQKFIFSAIFPLVGSSHWGWVGSVIVLIVALLSVYAEIKKTNAK